MMTRELVLKLYFNLLEGNRKLLGQRCFKIMLNAAYTMNLLVELEKDQYFSLCTVTLDVWCKTKCICYLYW